MTRSRLLCGLLAFVGVGLIATVPMACAGGGVGDPCTPEDEYDPQFPGFKLTLENIESRSFQCETRVCLVNHFQGRVSCPLGQPPPKDQGRLCTAVDGGGNVVGDDSMCTGFGGACTETSPIADDCDPDSEEPQCAGRKCNPEGRFCECDETTAVPLEGYECDVGNTRQFRAFVCHKEGNCQQPGDEENCTADGSPKECCIPGTETPVAVEVCGQCNAASNRNADQAVYCSCRCDVAEGDEADPNFNFCECPTGFECSEIRPNVGLGDPQITGKFCIKTDTAFDQATSPTLCTVDGYRGGSCEGTATGTCGGT